MTYRAFRTKSGFGRKQNQMMFFESITGIASAEAINLRLRA